MPLMVWSFANKIIAGGYAKRWCTHNWQKGNERAYHTPKNRIGYAKSQNPMASRNALRYGYYALPQAHCYRLHCEAFAQILVHAARGRVHILTGLPRTAAFG